MKPVITVKTVVLTSPEQVWEAFTTPAAICAWNAASEDWHTPRAENDLRVGGRFLSRMEAKDGSVGFDFTGTYTEVVPLLRIAYTMDGEDARKVTVTFTPTEGGVEVVITFEAEKENSLELQQAGWQAILDTFKRYCEDSTQG